MIKLFTRQFLDAVKGTFERPLSLLSEPLQHELYGLLGTRNAIMALYTKGADKFSKAYQNLPYDDRVEIFTALQKLGVNHADTIKAFDSKLGEGAYKVYKNMTDIAYSDPRIGVPISRNERYIPGLTGHIHSYSAAKLRGRSNMDGQTIHNLVANEDELSKHVLNLAKSKDFNIYDSAYNSLNRRLNKYLVLGMKPVEGTYVHLDPLDLTRIGPAKAKDPLYPDAPEQVVQVRYEYTPESFKTKIAKHVQDTFRGESEQANSINDFVLGLEGNGRPITFMDKLADGIVYQALVNNPGTAISNALDVFKSVAPTKAIIEAFDWIAKDPKIAEGFEGAVGLSTAKTELGQRLRSGFNLGDKYIDIPDFTEKIQSGVKKHLWLSQMIATIDNMPKEVNKSALKDKLKQYLTAEDPNDALKVYKSMVDEFGVTTADLTRQAMRETDRVAGRVDPANQRTLFTGGGRFLRMADSAIKDMQETYGAVKGSLAGDAEAQKRLGAIGRATGVKALLFGLPGIVSNDLVDAAQGVLPEQAQADMQKARNTWLKFGLVSAPANLMGVNTDRLVQPTIQGNPFAQSGVPILKEIGALTGNGEARSIQGRVTEPIGAAVKLGAAAGRVFAPYNPAVALVNALNPSMTGRVAYEGLRTLGVAPDSVGPMQYKFDDEVRGQTPVSYFNAILGTTPDYQEKALRRLVRALANED